MKLWIDYSVAFTELMGIFLKYHFCGFAVGSLFYRRVCKNS